MLAAVPAALLFATPAHAGAPPVSAHAFLIENPATGEILAQHGAWARAPIASITKLMTVLVTLDHARWNDVVRVRSAAAAVGEFIHKVLRPVVMGRDAMAIGACREVMIREVRNQGVTGISALGISASAVGEFLRRAMVRLKKVRYE